MTNLLHDKFTSTDVYGIDTIWSGILANDLMDLKPLLNQVSPQDPELLASYLVHGKLVSNAISAKCTGADVSHRFAFQIWLQDAAKELE